MVERMLTSHRIAVQNPEGSQQRYFTGGSSRAREWCQTKWASGTRGNKGS